MHRDSKSAANGYGQPNQNWCLSLKDGKLMITKEEEKLMNPKQITPSFMIPTCIVPFHLIDWGFLKHKLYAAENVDPHLFFQPFFPKI